MQNRWFQFWGISKPTYNVHSYKTYHIQKLNHTTCATHTHQLIRIHTEHIHNTYMCRIYIYITIFIYPLSTPILSILSNIQIHTHACMLHVLPASMYNTTHAHINKWLFWHYPTTPRLTYINGRNVSAVHANPRLLMCISYYHFRLPIRVRFACMCACVRCICVLLAAFAHNTPTSASTSVSFFPTPVYIITTRKSLAIISCETQKY